MGLFGKKKEEVPSLTELPELPELPRLREEEIEDEEEINRLPSLPNNSFGERFSQNAIKEAVSGRKEDEGEVDDAYDFAQEQTMQRLPRRSMTREAYNEDYEERVPMMREVPREFMEASRQTRSSEPVFIRLDKFEESVKIFEDSRRRILEIEKIIREIKAIKIEEERELDLWEQEIQFIKDQIDKIDRDIFSKVE